MILQSLPMAVPAQATQDSVQAAQKMSCCGGFCRCAANGCRCGEDKEKDSAPSKTPFSIPSIDLVAPLTNANYTLPALFVSEIVAVNPSTKIVVASNNCRQALLGRWQN
ncbi:MAG TPA: hypothetical protein EYO40_06445 [Phycisphaerales bacterium]|nr:hypothetical protein [Phycisphaerales bacterium]